MILAGIMGKSDLSDTEQQVIIMTNNRLNGCGYCMAAHSTLSEMSGIDASINNALRDNTPIDDKKIEVLRQFSIVVNETCGYPADAQVSAFIDAGYTKQTILEVILATSFKVMSNYTNHIANTEVDEAFSKNAWSK